MAEEIKSTPRPPETDGVSGRTFVKVRGRFSKSLVNPKTTRGKRAGRWRAVVWPYYHIDDGSMGGGEPITHVNPLNWDSGDGDPNFIDDYYNNPNLFSSERMGIFHYCVFCHECFADGDTDREGRGRTLDNFFVVCDARLDHPKDVDQAHKFIYELCKRNILGRPCPYGKKKCATSDDSDESYIGLCNECWSDMGNVPLVR